MKKILTTGLLILCMVFIIAAYFPPNNPDFAGIWQDGGGSITVDLVNGYEQVNTFDTDLPEAISDGDNTSNDITVGATGNYEIEFCAGGLAAANNKTYHFFAFEIDATGSTVAFATQANPVGISSVGHGFSTGNRVKITGVGGMVEINDKIYTIAAAGFTDSLFFIDVDDGTDVNGIGFTVWSSPGTVVLATRLTPVHSHRKFGTGTDQGAFSGCGIAALTLGKTVELWLKGTVDATNITVSHCTFYMKRLN